jgi:hypothetical protein
MTGGTSPHQPDYDAFLSHASKDSKFTATLYRARQTEGMKPWINELNVRVGERNAIQSAICDSRVLVLVWSDAAARSFWVMAELFTGFHLDRFIIPCVVDAAPLPLSLKTTAYLDRTRDKLTIGAKLCRAVRKVPDAANDAPV